MKMTTEALLLCEGQEKDKPTPHRFHHAQPVETKGGTVVYYRLMFECDLCKHQRVWGASVSGL